MRLEGAADDADQHDHDQRRKIEAAHRGQHRADWPQHRLGGFVHKVGNRTDGRLWSRPDPAQYRPNHQQDYEELQ